MTTLIRQYKCNICNAIYDSMDRAQNCENQGIPECTIDVGDIVIPTGKSHGWFDGKSEWVVNPNRIKDKNDPNDDTRPGMNGNISKFYYVVTAIDTPYGEHRWRFHLATKAGKMNKPSVSEWYTAYTYNLNVVDDPPQEVIDDSSDLIGITTKALL